MLGCRVLKGYIDVHAEFLESGFREYRCFETPGEENVGKMKGS